MLKIFWLILILGVLTHYGYSQIQIDFNSTNATLFPNKNLTLSFKVFGGKEPYTLNYTSIPRDWISKKNILVIPDYRQIVKTGWRFDVIVKDSSNNSISQTVMISFDNQQIIIFPVTLQPSVKDTASTFNKNTLGQPSFLNNIINRYPGKRAFGFDIDYFDNTVITSKLIQTTQAKYIPERDAQPLTPNKIQLDNANSRLQRATKLIANILARYDEISKGMQILTNQVPVQMESVKQLKTKTFDCQTEVSEFQNVQAKFNNAIDDRDIKIKQERQLIQQDNKVIFQLRNNISLLINNKTSIQKAVAPESQILSQAQQNIAKCQSKIKDTDVQIENLGISKKNNQLQISLAEDNMTNSDNRLRQIDSSLVLVRQTIQDLQKQLKQAREQQRSLLQNKRTYQSAPVQAKRKMNQLILKNNDLQKQIRSLTDRNKDETKKCTAVKNTFGQRKISALQKQVDYKKIITQLQQSQKKMQQMQRSVHNHNKTIQNLTLQNFKLRNQYTENTIRLSQLDFKCKVALETQRKKQVQLNQILSQIESLNNSKNQLNTRLNNARAQQQLADMALNQILQKSAPYVPIFFPPTNAGDFRSDSPVPERGIPGGPPFRITQILRGDFSVPLRYFNSYFSQRNIDPTALLDIITNQKQNRNFNFRYVFNPANNQTFMIFSKFQKNASEQFWRNKGLQKFIQSNCDSKGITSHSGIITSLDIASGAINVKTKQDKNFLISISPCTLISWTRKQNNTFPLRAGLRIYFQGVLVSSVGGVEVFSAYLILITP